MDNKREQFDQLVAEAKKIAIVAHMGLDDDAIASCLAVYAYLRKHFPQKEARIYNESPPYSEWDWMKNADKLEYVERLPDHLDDIDLIIFLDGQTVDRFTDYSDKINLEDFDTVRIDHHPGKADNFDLDFSEDDAIATSQILANLLFSGEEAITPGIAETLLVGILGDSGSFRFVRPENAEVFSLVERLVVKGKVELQRLQLKMFQLDEGVWKLIQILVANTRNVKLEKLPNLTCSYLPKDVLGQYSEEEISTAYHQYLFMFVRQIRAHPWGFVVAKKKPDRFNVSFRSMTGGPKVKALAHALGGGGHERAAAAKLQVDDPAIDSPEIVEKVLKTIRGMELEMIE